MADTSTIRVPVAPPTVNPRRFGLLDAITPVTPASPHWRVGVTWEGSAGCGATTSTTSDACLTGATPDPLVLTGGCRTRRSAVAFTVYSRQRRTLLDEDTTVEAFDAAEARAVEAEFYAAVLADAGLVDLGDAWPSLAVALATVEQGIADRYNGLGLIHVSARDASLLGDLLVSTDGGLYTRLGTPVVVGIGYEADDTTSLIVGTGAVLLMRGESEPVSVDAPSTNDTETLVQRTWVAGWDCFAVSAGTAAPTETP